jgi:uncharacterized membrane protein
MGVTMTTEEPETSGRQSRLVLVIVTGLALVWTGGVVLAPWLSAHDSVLGGWLRLLYRPGCHQMAERCLDIGFGPLAVCARCAGLYLGVCLGLLSTTIIGRSLRPKPRWLAIVAVPTVVDFTAARTGLPSASNWARFILATPLGLLAGLYLADALIEIVRRNSPTGTGRSGQDPVG